MKTIAFFDLETSLKTDQIVDIGCIRSDETTFHDRSIAKFMELIEDADFICGHNIYNHDLRYLQRHTGNDDFGLATAIDTLFLSPLLFPSHPYH